MASSSFSWNVVYASRAEISCAFSAATSTPALRTRARAHACQTTTRSKTCDKTRGSRVAATWQTRGTKGGCVLPGFEGLVLCHQLAFDHVIPAPIKKKKQHSALFS